MAAGAIAASGASAGFTLPAVCAAAIGIATVAVLWRLYLLATQSETGNSTGGVAKALMVAGAAIAAVGCVLVFADPFATAGAAALATVLGGPAVSLVGDIAAGRAATGKTPASRAVAIAALAIVALIGFVLPALVLAALAFAVLLLLALAASGWFRFPSLSVRD